MPGNSSNWHSTSLEAQDSSQTPTAVRLINCHEPDALENSSRCIYRDDITAKLNIAYSSLFPVFAIAFVLVCWNLIKLSKITRTPRRVLVYRAVNAFILISLLARLTYYFNSVVLLVFDEFLPLQYYMTLNALSILTLNTAMLIGAYSWILSMLTMNFNNRLKPCFRAINYILVTLNLITFVILATLFFAYDLKDQDYARDYDTNLPSLLLAVPTAIDGIYFSLTCIMLWRLLQSSPDGRKDLCLDRIALIAGIVSFLRVGQNTIEITLDYAGDIREKSIQQDDWVWPIISVIYMLVTEFFPIMLLLLKFGPSSKVLRASDIESEKEVHTRILNEEDLDREIQEYLYAKASKQVCQSSINSSAYGRSRATTMDEKPAYA